MIRRAMIPSIASMISLIHTHDNTRDKSQVERTNREMKRRDNSICSGIVGEVAIWERKPKYAHRLASKASSFACKCSFK